MTLNTEDLPPMSPSVASVGTMSMNMGLAGTQDCCQTFCWCNTSTGNY